MSHVLRPIFYSGEFSAFGRVFGIRVRLGPKSVRLDRLRFRHEGRLCVKILCADSVAEVKISLLSWKDRAKKNCFVDKSVTEQRSRQMPLGKKRAVNTKSL